MIYGYCQKVVNVIYRKVEFAIEIYSKSTTCNASNGAWDRQESQRKIETD